MTTSNQNETMHAENKDKPQQRTSVFGMAIDGLRRTMGSGEDARNEDGSPKPRLSLFAMRTSMTAKLGQALDEDTKRKDSVRASQHAAMRASGMDPTQSPLQRAKSRLLSTLDEPLELRSTKKLSEIELSPDFKNSAKPAEDKKTAEKNTEAKPNDMQTRMSYMEKQLALQTQKLAEIKNKQQNLSSAGARPSFVARSIEASVIGASEALSRLGDFMGVEGPNVKAVEEDVAKDGDDFPKRKDVLFFSSDSSDSSEGSDGGRAAVSTVSLGPRALDLLNRRRESRRESRSATPAHGAKVAVSPTMSPRQRFLENQRKASISVPPITKPGALSPKTSNQPTPSMRPINDPLSGHLFAVEEVDHESASSCVASQHRDNSTRTALLHEEELKALKQKEEDEGAPHSPRQSFSANPMMMPLDLSEGQKSSGKSNRKSPGAQQSSRYSSNRKSPGAQPRRSSMFAGIIPGIVPGSKADESALFLQDLFFKLGGRLVLMFFFIWCGVMFYQAQLAINHGAPELPELEQRAQRRAGYRKTNRGGYQKTNSRRVGDEEQFDLNSLLDMDAETRDQILAVLDAAKKKGKSSKNEEDL